MSEEETAEDIEQMVEAQAEEIKVEGLNADGEETQEGAELDKRKSKGGGSHYFFAS